MVVGICMCKDELDVIEATVRQMAQEVDAVIVADNGSTDGTRELLEDLGVIVQDDPEVGYFQSAKMSALAQEAVERFDADWVVPFDADEWWYSPFGRIADVLEAHDGAVATAAIYDHRATADDPEGEPLERMGWRTTEPLPLHKVACRPLLRATITQGNHGAHYLTQVPLEGQLIIRHFPIRSVEQMVHKARVGAAAYAATDLPEDVGGHWRGWGKLTDEQIGDVFREYYWSADPSADPDLIFDPCPALSASFPG